ncbi:hypothetical protein BPY_07090 [Bifidobacterium psychraerophilum]|uniref:hypothetical protein n=1 Tax=Bifidobacterium psychraerophilum TaxID=218140 RepID=UPI00310EF7F0
MSIATDEANSVADEQMMSHFYYSDSPMSFPDAKDFGKDMYVAGRTAEPTEAEIEAAAIKYYSFNSHLDDYETQRMWDEGLMEITKDDYRELSKAMLLAAQKAVME